MEIVPGSIVRSKRGRDAGGYFLVARIEGEYVFLVDGKHRRVSEPKKKKIKHVEPTGENDAAIGAKFVGGAYVFDSEVFSALKKCQEKEENLSVERRCH